MQAQPHDQCATIQTREESGPVSRARPYDDGWAGWNAWRARRFEGDLERGRRRLQMVSFGDQEGAAVARGVDGPQREPVAVELAPGLVATAGRGGGDVRER